MAAINDDLDDDGEIELHPPTAERVARAGLGDLTQPQVYRATWAVEGLAVPAEVVRSGAINLRIPGYNPTVWTTPQE